MPKRVPVEALKRLCKEQSLKVSILLAFDGERTHVVTYGETIEDCSRAADFGNQVKTLMGWPESLQAQPSRVRKLEKRIAELEKALEEEVKAGQQRLEEKE